ncbi:MAG: prepilin-type N-terminal cleavage/methylation domain-containing protein [Sulfuritalea sp.]|nr:prepilin-type N-terminal cleavage/methylation domain-containing protein [Sulfuritalea sp.]
MFSDASRPSRYRRGFTLIELIVFILIVSVSVVGILLVMDTTVKSSADPVVRKQSLAMAEAILDEVLSREFANPVGGYAEAAPATCANRALYDDVDDYRCFDGTTDNKKIHGDSTLGSSPIAALAAYRATVVVDATAGAVLGAIPVGQIKKITVTVTGGSETIQLSGYRANY